MVKVISTKYVCDLCKIEHNEEKELVNVPVLQRHYCDDTEGRSCEPYITVDRMDLCPSCMDLVCNVNVGFRGSNVELRRITK